MNKFTRLVSLLGLSVLVAAGSFAILPSTASAKTTMVKAHSMKTKSGKMVMVKAHTRTTMSKIKVHGYTRITKGGKIIRVKPYMRKPTMMKPHSHPMIPAKPM